MSVRFIFSPTKFHSIKLKCVLTLNENVCSEKANNYLYNFDCLKWFSFIIYLSYFSILKWKLFNILELFLSPSVIFIPIESFFLFNNSFFLKIYCLIWIIIFFRPRMKKWIESVHSLRQYRVTSRNKTT